MIAHVPVEELDKPAGSQEMLGRKLKIGGELYEDLDHVHAR